MAYCKHCEKEVEAVKKRGRWYCPECNLFVSMSDTERGEAQVEVVNPVKEIEEKSKKGRPKKEPEMEIEGPTKLIVAPKTIKYDATDLHMGEILINLGFAKDLNDLTRKNMKLAFSLFNMGAMGKQFNADKMEELNEPDPKKTMKQLQEQKLMEAYISNMDREGKTDPMQMMMMMRMLENQDKGKSNDGNGFMNSLMMMQMMQAMSKPQSDAGLQREIADLKNQMQMQQMMNQQAQMQQGSNSSQNFMQQMEQIRAERDQSIKAAEISAQQERDKNLAMAFDNRRIELESRLKAMEREMKEKGSGQIATQRLVQMKDEIAAVKEMSKILGDKEKGAGEYISETVGNLATTLQPTLARLIEQKNAQPQQLPPMPAEAYGAVANAQFQPQQLPLGNPELTDTERQMSQRAEEMYINPQPEPEDNKNNE